MLVKTVLCIMVAASAFLVIFVQPAVAVAILPSTGSNPYVWHGVQAAFQGLLICGYGLAGWIGRPSSGRLRIYSLFVAAAAAGLALTLGRGLATLNGALDLPFGMLSMFAAPFIALSTFSISAQLILASTTGERRPVWLYAASNCGSLLAVLAYPVVIEPNLDVGVQLRLWSVATIPLLVGALCAALYAARRAAPAARSGTSSVEQAESVTVPQALSWLAGGFCPVGLSLACTSYLSVDLGSHPLVWLGPFSIYLATLILAFSNSGSRITRWLGHLAPWAIVTVAVMLIAQVGSLVAYLAHLCALALVLARWHTWVVERRPRVPQLPFYFTCLAAGGFLSSIVVALGAPALLDPTWFGDANRVLHRAVFGSMAPEYLLFLLSTCAIVPRADRGEGHQAMIASLLNGAGWGAASMIAVPVVLRIADTRLPLDTDILAWVKFLASLAVMAGGAAMLRIRLETGAAVAAALLMYVNHASASNHIVVRTRSLFGHLAVVEQGGYRRLLHGTTLHGSQTVDCANRSDPGPCGQATTYYETDGPVGLLLQTERERTGGRLDMAVIGLGTGTMGSYCRPDDTLTFFEIDPVVLRLAEGYFTYLKQARATCRSVDLAIGDARLMLRRRPADSIDLLIVDAFSSDAIPPHLMTAEAMQEFARTLHGSGTIAFHLSNRYFDLVPTLAATAKRAGLLAFVIRDDGSRRRQPSVWAVLTADGARPGVLRQALRNQSAGRLFERTVRGDGVPWTDGRHSLLAVLDRRAESAAPMRAQGAPSLRIPE